MVSDWTLPALLYRDRSLVREDLEMRMRMQREEEEVTWTREDQTNMQSLDRIAKALERIAKQLEAQNEGGTDGAHMQ